MTARSAISPALQIVFLACALSACRTPSATFDTSRGSQAGPPGRGGSAERLFLEGSLLEMQERYQDAIDSYRQALWLDSTSAPVLYAIAKCYSHLHNGDSTLRYARLSVAHDSTRPEALKLLASTLLSEGRYAAAVQQFEALLRVTPDDAQARYMAAQIWQRIDSDRAIVHLEYIRRNFQEDEGTLLTLAEIYLNKERYDQAIEVLRQLIASQGGNPDLYHLLGQTLLRVERYDDALRLLDQMSTELAGDSLAEAYVQDQLTLALDLLESNDGGPRFRDYARRLAVAAAKRHPSDRSVMLLGGLIDVQLADSGRGDSIVTRALRSPAATSAEWTRAARGYLGIGRNEALLALLAPLGRRFDDDFEVPFLIGIGYWAVGREDSAERYVRRSIALNEENPWAWSAIAHIYDKSGRHGAGDHAFERAIELAPEDPIHLNNYAFALADRSVHLDSALALIARALEAEPDNEMFLDTIGWIYFKLRDYEQALHYIRRSVDIGGADADVLEHLGDVYAALGRPGPAGDEYRRALKLKPSSTTLKSKIRSTR